MSQLDSQPRSSGFIPLLDPAKWKRLSSKVPKDTPVVMINLVKFNEKALYPSDSKHSPCTGKEAYFDRYTKCFNEIINTEKIEGVKLIYRGQILSSLIMNDSEHYWDAAVIMQYPTWAIFNKIATGALYMKEADIHRKAALKDWKFLITTPSLNKQSKL